MCEYFIFSGSNVGSFCFVTISANIALMYQQQYQNFRIYKVKK